LYDFSTAGCRDGVEVSEVSENQGAESTVSFLLALLTMLDQAGVGSESVTAVPDSAAPSTPPRMLRD
jgi:hypothetical protein